MVALNLHNQNSTYFNKSFLRTVQIRIFPTQASTNYSPQLNFPRKEQLNCGRLNKRK